MKALITGASSGIGAEVAKYLSELNIDLILVGRNKERLEEVANGLNVNVKLIVMDLSSIEKVKDLYVLTKGDDIDILVNNAGFGLFGDFLETDLKKEIEMIDVNIVALHMLTKLYLKDMQKKNSGYILNVASAAGFGSGPLMATYYGTKSYVLALTEAIYEELRRNGSGVSISVLCPGPVLTNFNNVAGVSFKGSALASDYVARYAIKNMFQKKLIIIPGFKIKLVTFLRRLAPRKLILKITYNFQSKKK